LTDEFACRNFLLSGGGYAETFGPRRDPGDPMAKYFDQTLAFTKPWKF
jgi:hypothetical protein